MDKHKSKEDIDLGVNAHHFSLGNVHKYYVARGPVPPKISPVPYVSEFRGLWNSSETSPNGRGLYWGLGDFFHRTLNVPQKIGDFSGTSPKSLDQSGTPTRPLSCTLKKVQKNLKF